MPDNNKHPTVIISCQVFQYLLEEHLPANASVKSITYLDQGLHLIPRNLKDAIQKEIERIEVPSLIILGYGLCGNGLDGIRSGQHTLLVPRTDDCISIFMGSYQAYQHQFHNNPATYYLSKGWLDSASNPLSEYEKYKEKYGVETADYLMDVQYQHYKRLVLVAHNEDELRKYRPLAKQVAVYCERWGMVYEEIIGSDDYIRQLMEASQALEKAGTEFIVVPPGGKLKQADFLR